MKKISVFILLLLCASVFNAQTKYTLSPDSKMKVDGSSTVSDWSVEVIEPTGDFVLVDDFKIEVGAAILSNLSFSFEVEKMDSGRGPIMNGKVESALKSDDHPNVSFTSNEAKITAVDADGFTAESIGTIKIAGVEKEITVVFKVTTENNNGSFHFKGNKGVTMSMFSIEKPTAFFGKLKTMDDLDVSFHLKFTK
ncbi:YceI family protein [uncultured Algibacter sp.]|uniref:YceI family protein n=1 Tax=uncultured Algibacter sp. TaxID=298659 RepID=UPI00262E988F|nr:YceI family protein [uncultured Algibacter sp.]